MELTTTPLLPKAERSARKNVRYASRWLPFLPEPPLPAQRGLLLTAMFNKKAQPAALSLLHTLPIAIVLPTFKTAPVCFREAKGLLKTENACKREGSL